MKKKTRSSPNIRNGPNGISLFIVSRFPLKFNKGILIRIILIKAPIQKERIIAVMPKESPRSHPMPSASLPSPRPIHVPREKNQKLKKNRKNMGPERNGRSVGILI
ncbi:MAG TPA: hypothetical protein QGF60_00730 [Candidatus Paceibacterota bacterium]|nr:hypothetical protein [Candidatus Paceibacterota bacterium]